MPPVAAAGASAPSLGGATEVPALRRPFKLPTLRKQEQVAEMPDRCAEQQAEQALPPVEGGSKQQPEALQALPPASVPPAALPRARLPGLRSKKRPAAAPTGQTDMKADDSAQTEEPETGQRSSPVEAPTNAAPKMVPALAEQLPPPAGKRVPTEQLGHSVQQTEPANVKHPAARMAPPTGWRAARLPAVLPETLPAPPAPSTMPPATRLLGT